MNENQDTPRPTLPHLPDAETILEELAKAKSIDDLTGIIGIYKCGQATFVSHTNGRSPGMGNVAVTEVRMPPRGVKLPVTLHRTGWQLATMSSSILFTTCS